MSNLRFDGRVAIVTGAGRGIGGSYARYLGSLGAQVVVNDLGGTTDGVGFNPGPAQKVSDEINELGGTAVADTSDVSSVEGGANIVKTATKVRRIDAIVNNAGNVIPSALPDADIDVIESHLAIDTKGTFNVIRPAWPYMLEQDYGRVVLTGSTGMFGLLDNLGYAIAKSAMIGMAHSLTVGRGQEHQRQRHRPQRDDADGARAIRGLGNTEAALLAEDDRAGRERDDESRPGRSHGRVSRP